MRNKLFDWNILKSASFNFPIICVGNLAVGGTGKTPMTEFIVKAFRNQYKVAILSRGYKRKTRGFAIAHQNTTALEIGDEPMQFHHKFPDIIVAVGEERLVAIPQILYQHPETEFIILDDAFQHRSVKAGLNILLTEYNNLFTRDLMLPSGDLRDTRSEKKRAQIIIVTKCKKGLSESERQQIIQEIEPNPNQQVLFSSIRHDKPYHLFSKQEIEIGEHTDVLLVCGIANPRPIKDMLTKTVKYYEMLRFPDHHIFTSNDLKEIKEQFEKIASKNKIILTTEKDAVRMEKFGDLLKDYPIYVLPISHYFLFNEEDSFKKKIESFISGFKKS
jgi:tetraacyldisaccharide 4'-kinase